ncbi:hypothetical protein Fmac_027332 [Flemingia macrophylla]|uniref:FLZ-type domain-containing protein n=1 Tax=Flemingia macrophylla TaxID=520843 RepID=A0ABD1LHX9_9FABA
MHFSAPTTTRPCYLEQDHGLASLNNMESCHHRANNFVSRSMTMGYATSFTFRNTLSVSSPRLQDHHHPHFLAACSLCRKPLGDNRDIFMYRGDTPFCSEECRQEQIEIDEAKEKNRNQNLSSSIKALRKSNKSPNKAQDYSFRTGAVAAA